MKVSQKCITEARRCAIREVSSARSEPSTRLLSQPKMQTIWTSSFTLSDLFRSSQSMKPVGVERRICEVGVVMSAAAGDRIAQGVSPAPLPQPAAAT
eukprot:178556-Rhodomonas_salina.1